MDKNNDALKAMQADAAKLGFQMASESDFAVTDEELEGDLEEVNEEAEVEELEAASQQEKLAFLNTRFEELKVIVCVCICCLVVLCCGVVLCVVWVLALLGMTTVACALLIIL